MALYRTVSTAFWTDSKVIDDFTPEDRYFYLYLFTNPHTNLCGCYEISLTQVSNETGYSKASVENLIERFQSVHKVIAYDKNVKEVLLLNWHKYNWTKSDKFKKAVEKEISSIKNQDFREFLESKLYGIDTVSEKSDRVSSSERYPMDTTNTNSNTISNTDSVTEEKYPVEQVIEYLNEKAGTAFKPTTPDTRKHIRARFAEKYTLEDFKKVIDNKVAEWKGTDMEKYLRPATLFGTKFEGYLNQKPVRKKPKNSFNNFSGRTYDYAELERMLIAAQ